MNFPREKTEDGGGDNSWVVFIIFACGSMWILPSNEDMRQPRMLRMTLRSNTTLASIHRTILTFVPETKYKEGPTHHPRRHSES